MNIGFLGCAGCGKGHVAAKLSQKLKIPYLNSKDITRPVLKKYGYEYREDNYVEKFLSRKSPQFQIVDQRIYQQSLLSGGFITDRTTLQCFAYSFLNLCSYTAEQFQLLQKMCRQNLNKFDVLYYFQQQGSWIQDNGLRTKDINLQWKIDILIRGLIQDWELQDKVVKIPKLVMKQGNMYQFICEDLDKR